MAEHACAICGEDAQLLPRDGRFGARPVRGLHCARCGYYFLTDEAQSELQRRSPRERAMLAAITYERSAQGVPILLYSSGYRPSEGDPDGYGIAEALETMYPRSVSERIDRALLNLARKSRYPGDEIVIPEPESLPLLFAENQEVLHFTLAHLVKSDLIDGDAGIGGIANFSLTARGWERVGQLERPGLQSLQAFVAMWFDEKLDAAYEEGMRPAIEEAGYTPRRVKEENFLEKICDHIIAEIRKSRFLVADVTGQRQAVYFEAGFAMGLGLPVIFACHRSEIEQCCFDTRQYKHIVWEEAADLREQLRDMIAATIPQPR
jgi:hypothetical protein